MAQYIHVYDKFHKEYGDLQEPGHIYLDKEYVSTLTIDPKRTILVKEDIHSDDFLRLYFHLCNPKKNFCSHVFVGQHKWTARRFILTDCALNIEPTLEQLVKIVENAARFYRTLDGPTDKYDDDVLSVNLVNYKNEFDLNNPICRTKVLLEKSLEYNNDALSVASWQFDCCIDRDARKKKFGQAALDPDIIVVPNLYVGNPLYKAMLIDYDLYGFVIGGEQPAVLNSRSALDKNQECIKMLEKIIKD